MSNLDVEKLFARLRPGSRVVGVRPLADDEGTSDRETHKDIGYGRPHLVELAVGDERERYVVHVPRANPFGHDRRADRVADVVLAQDTFPRIPAQAEVVDEHRRRLVTAARRHGKGVAMLTDSLDGVRHMIALGATLVNYASDAAVLRSGYASVVGAIRRPH